MDETTDIPPEKFPGRGFRSVQCWTEQGGLRIVGFRSAQAKIPKGLGNALRCLKFQDGRWHMFLRDHTNETGANFPTYTWQNGCWELVNEAAYLHASKERNVKTIRRSMLRSIEGAKHIGIRTGQAEPSALDRKPKDWRMR